MKQLYPSHLSQTVVPCTQEMVDKTQKQRWTGLDMEAVRDNMQSWLGSQNLCQTKLISLSNYLLLTANYLLLGNFTIYSTTHDCGFTFILVRFISCNA